MITRHRRLLISLLMAALAGTVARELSAAEARAKNWIAPSADILVQKLTNEVMKAHPELISITFHGVPPGAAPRTYTMFGGSYVDRIGNPDDPDDIMVSETGITILDPRWHRTADPLPKYVVMTPLRDARGENIGLLVLAYHRGAHRMKTDEDYLRAGTRLRDELSRRITHFESLFKGPK